MTNDLIQKLRALITPDENGLLPCEHCRSHAEVYSATIRRPEPDGTINGHWVVDCTECDASIEFCRSVDDAVSKWNTRAYIPLVEEAIKALEARDGSN